MKLSYNNNDFILGNETSNNCENTRPLNTLITLIINVYLLIGDGMQVKKAPLFNSATIYKDHTITPNCW